MREGTQGHYNRQRHARRCLECQRLFVVRWNGPNAQRYCGKRCMDRAKSCDYRERKKQEYDRAHKG